jgi:hypothetical protein
MAKSTGKGGLPAGFNLSVSSEDLLGKPVQVGGYLDEDPVFELIKAQRQQVRVEEVKTPTRQAPAASPPPKAPIIPEARQEDVVAPTTRAAFPQQTAPEQVPQAVTAPVNQDSLQAEVPKTKKVRPPIRRLQINLTPDSERQVNELLEIISAQSAEKNIMFSEILNALILNLYEARADLNVSRVPPRGKWGAPTAKSFPIALAQAFREAIITYGMKNGANQFKKVVGG